MQMVGRGCTTCLICGEVATSVMKHMFIVYQTKLLYEDTDEFNIMLMSSKICIRCVGRLSQLFDFNLLKTNLDMRRHGESYGEYNEDWCHFCQSEHVMAEKFEPEVSEAVSKTKWSKFPEGYPNTLSCYSCYNFLLLYTEIKKTLDEERINFYMRLRTWKVFIQTDTKNGTEIPNNVIRQQSNADSEHEAPNLTEGLAAVEIKTDPGTIASAASEEENINEKDVPHVKAVKKQSRPKATLLERLKTDFNDNEVEGNSPPVDKYDLIKMRRAAKRTEATSAPLPVKKSKKAKAKPEVVDKKPLNKSLPSESVVVAQVKAANEIKLNKSLPKELLVVETEPVKPAPREDSRKFVEIKNFKRMSITRPNVLRNRKQALRGRVSYPEDEVVIAVDTLHLQPGVIDLTDDSESDSIEQDKNVTEPDVKLQSEDGIIEQQTEKEPSPDYQEEAAEQSESIPGKIELSLELAATENLSNDSQTMEAEDETILEVQSQTQSAQVESHQELEESEQIVTEMQPAEEVLIDQQVTLPETDKFNDYANELNSNDKLFEKQPEAESQTGIESGAENDVEEETQQEAEAQPEIGHDAEAQHELEIQDEIIVADEDDMIVEERIEDIDETAEEVYEDHLMEVVDEDQQNDTSETIIEAEVDVISESENENESQDMSVQVQGIIQELDYQESSGEFEEEHIVGQDEILMTGLNDTGIQEVIIGGDESDNELCDIREPRIYPMETTEYDEELFPEANAVSTDDDNSQCGSNGPLGEEVNTTPPDYSKYNLKGLSIILERVTPENLKKILKKRLPDAFKFTKSGRKYKPKVIMDPSAPEPEKKPPKSKAKSKVSPKKSKSQEKRKSKEKTPDNIQEKSDKNSKSPGVEDQELKSSRLRRSQEKLPSKRSTKSKSPEHFEEKPKQSKKQRKSKEKQSETRKSKEKSPKSATKALQSKLEAESQLNSPSVDIGPFDLQYPDESFLNGVELTEAYVDYTTERGETDHSYIVSINPKFMSAEDFQRQGNFRKTLPVAQNYVILRTIPLTT